MDNSNRLQIIPLHTPQMDVAEELRLGLTSSPKWLPSKWLYDKVGSDLFEQICNLPEYYPTRTESGILQHKADAIIELCPSSLSLVELGSGSSRKTRYLIEACLRHQPKLNYYAIDISQAALEMAADWMLHDFDNLHVTGLVGEFVSGLDYLREHHNGPQLVAFLGSTIGNLNEQEMDDFFTLLRQDLTEEDRFLLGFDFRKDLSILVPAYDDAQGVTAQFNLNMLGRLNREYQANFDLSAFEHRALFNEKMSRIEMHLVSKRPQTVAIPGLGMEVKFSRGEPIHTENSHKYSLEAMQEHMKSHGFTLQATFTDAKRLFCLALFY